MPTDNSRGGWWASRRPAVASTRPSATDARAEGRAWARGILAAEEE
jgi:hypothetical protein